MKNLISYKLFESSFGWNFYKKHPETAGVASDVLSELEDRFRVKIEPVSSETGDVLNIEIKPSIRVTGYVFPFGDIRNVIVELISQLEGNGLKFYQYRIDTKPNWTGNWCRGVKDILNDNITKSKIYGFEIEFRG